MGFRKAHLYCLLLIPILVLAGCASLPTTKPEPPTVRVENLRAQSFSLNEARLRFTLRVTNPNPFDLPLRSLDFVADLEGETFASGRSTEAVTIPALGDALLDIDVIAGISKVFGRLKSVIRNDSARLNYGISGHVSLSNWPSRIPFNVEGNLERPKLD